MDFSFSEEQMMLKESIRDFIKNEYSFEARQKLIASEEGFSREHLKTFTQLDWNCVPFSEDDGGFGGTAVDVIAVMEEFGKGLIVEPYFPSVILAGGFLKKGGNAEQKEQHINAIIEGSALYAAALSEPNSRYDWYDVATTATQEGDGFILSGHKIFVLAGHVADTFVITARTSYSQKDRDGISLFLVDANANGLTKQSFPTVDGSRVANLKFDQVKVESSALLGTLGDGASIIDDAMNEAIVALAAEAIGALEVLCQSTVEYSKIRVQFNQPIGKFQSLQMIMSEMFIEHVLIKSLLAMTAMKVDQGTDVPRSISALKVQLGKAIRFIGQNAIQLHGGIGMTDELAVSHYFKRVTVIASMFGDADYHLDRFIACS